MYCVFFVLFFTAHDVELRADLASLSSSHRLARKLTWRMDAVEDTYRSPKLSLGLVLPSSFHFGCGLDKPEEPQSYPEDSAPLRTSSCHQVGPVEDAGPSTSTPGVSRKRQREEDAKAELLARWLGPGTVLPKKKPRRRPFVSRPGKVQLCVPPRSPLRQFRPSQDLFPSFTTWWFSGPMYAFTPWVNLA